MGGCGCSHPLFLLSWVHIFFFFFLLSGSIPFASFQPLSSLCIQHVHCKDWEHACRCFHSRIVIMPRSCRCVRVRLPLSSYVTSLYYAVTTLTTVGYGDISATNPREMVFATIAMVLGAVLYAVIMGSVVSVVEQVGSGQACVVLCGLLCCSAALLTGWLPLSAPGPRAPICAGAQGSNFLGGPICAGAGAPTFTWIPFSDSAQTQLRSEHKTRLDISIASGVLAGCCLMQSEMLTAKLEEIERWASLNNVEPRIANKVLNTARFHSDVMACVEQDERWKNALKASAARKCPTERPSTVE